VIHGDEHYVTTIGGRKFWPLDPRAEDICIQDIAHSLAHICRFNGHVRTFYSVAQHSLLVATHVPPEFALYGLLHDAAEAYLGDLSSPIKHSAQMRRFRSADKKLTAMIYRRFGLHGAEPSIVKVVDRTLIVDEIRDVALHVGVRQPHLQGPGLGIRISPMCPEEAGHAFLFRFHQLAGVQDAASR
jgi:hypothetical protein